MPVPCAAGEAGPGADATGGSSRDQVTEGPMCSASELGPFPEGPVRESWDLRF